MTFATTATAGEAGASFATAFRLTFPQADGKALAFAVDPVDNSTETAFARAMVTGSGNLAGPSLPGTVQDALYIATIPTGGVSATSYRDEPADGGASAAAASGNGPGSDTFDEDLCNGGFTSYSSSMSGVP